jgi:hypothetical protein
MNFQISKVPYLVLLVLVLALPSCNGERQERAEEPAAPQAAPSELIISNPQQFEVRATIQPRGTEVLESRNLPPGGQWKVPGPGNPGLWLSFHRTSDDQLLTGALLKEGTTVAQLLLNTEIALLFKQNPEEKLNLANGLEQKVKVAYELQREIAISTHTLEPLGQPGSSIVAEQQPTANVDLWISFSQEDGTLLSTFIASDAVAEVSIQGKEHYCVGTPYCGG